MKHTAIALALLGASTLGLTQTSHAMSLPGQSALKEAAPSHTTEVQWRRGGWWGPGIGVGLGVGLAAGALTAAALGPWGGGYWGGYPGYAYGPGPGYDYGYAAPAPAPAYDYGYAAPAPAPAYDYGYAAPAPAPAYDYGYAAPAPAYDYGYAAPAPAYDYGYAAPAYSDAYGPTGYAPAYYGTTYVRPRARYGYARVGTGVRYANTWGSGVRSAYSSGPRYRAVGSRSAVRVASRRR